MRLLFIFLSFSLFACEKKNPKLDSLMQKQLAEWKFNTEVTSVEKNNELNIDILFKKFPNKGIFESYYFYTLDSISEYRHCGISNIAIAEMLCNKFYPYIKDKDSVNFVMRFDYDNKNYLILKQSKENVKKTVILFNPTVEHFVEYAFFNYDKVYLYFLDGRIQYLKKKYPDLFKPKDGFFNLLVDYISASENLDRLTETKDMMPIIDFFFLIRSTKAFGEQRPAIKEVYKKLLYYYEYFDFKEEWLEYEDYEDTLAAFFIYQKELYEKNKKK